MAYEQIDFILKPWAESLNLHIFKDFCGQEYRFLYVTNSKNDCYQINIEYKGNSEFCISISFIDGDNANEGYEHHIPTSIEKLSSALSEAYTKVLSL